MRKLLSALALVTGSVHAQSTIQMPVVCGKTDVMMGALAEYDEDPVWMAVSKGNDKDFVAYAVVVNKETGAWTFIKFNTRATCILAVGEHSRLVGPVTRSK